MEPTMTKPRTPLRQRMIEDMTIRNMSPSTRNVYVAAVSRFARHHGMAPDQLGAEHVRSFRLHLLESGLKARTINAIVGGIRFFYANTLGKPEIADQIAYAR